MTITAPLPRFAHRARFALAVSLAATLGCATPRALRSGSGAVPFGAGKVPTSERGPADAPGPKADAAVEGVLAAARAALGESRPELDGRPLPTDCSGFVRGVYTKAGVDLFSEAKPWDNGVRAMVRWIERHGQMHRRKVPAPGDLVFFHDSYDRNGDGKLNDRFTHMGLVEEVLPDGTALIIHATNHGIVREPMNLMRPHEAKDSQGREINAILRRKTAEDSPGTPRLMSELFAGFGRVLHRDPEDA
jgi:peptidoglycan DL-endopeptidase CwlO